MQNQNNIEEVLPALKMIGFPGLPSEDNPEADDGVLERALVRHLETSGY